MNGHPQALHEGSHRPQRKTVVSPGLQAGDPCRTFPPGFEPALPPTGFVVSRKAFLPFSSFLFSKTVIRVWIHKVINTQEAQEVGSSSCYHPHSLLPSETDFSSLKSQVTWPHRRAGCPEAREIGVHPTSREAMRDKDSALNLCRITQRLLLQKLRVQ